MKNNELLDALRSGNTDDISPRSRAEAIAIAIRQKMEGTVEGTDVSTDTVTAETLLKGVTAYNSDGKLIKGIHTCKDSSTVITDFSYFCKDGDRIDVLEHISTSNGTTFRGMFQNRSSLTSVPQLDTSSGKFFSNMFYGCKSLTAIPPLDTSKGTGTAFTSMFYGCSSLTSIPQLDTSNGASFQSMFDGCKSLTSIPQLDTSNGTNFDNMFNGCSSLTSVPQLDTSNGTNFTRMFAECSSLTSIPQLDTSNGTYFQRMFYRCTSLKDIAFAGTINTGGMDLSYSKSLTKASVTSLVNALSSTVSGQSVTVSQTAVNNAFTTEEWNALKATKSNWAIELIDA